jgi:hypothetical protein
MVYCELSSWYDSKQTLYDTLKSLLSAVNNCLISLPFVLFRLLDHYLLKFWPQNFFLEDQD